MKVSKSYKLLRFLNKRHSVLSRYPLAALGWLGAMVCTREPVLARALAAEFISNQYELAFRKAARYARRCWPSFNPISDPFFNFTQGTTQQERNALLRSLKRRRSKLPKADYLTDQLYILAATIHHQLESNNQPDIEIARFYALANDALSIAETKDRSTIKPSGNLARAPNFSRAQATQALEDLAALLPVDQWRWFIISGTLLGLHREGSFLPHDYDIDTGIHAEKLDISLLLRTIEHSNAFVIEQLDHYVEINHHNGQRKLRNQPSMLKIIHSTGIRVDIFFHYTEHDKCWHGSVIHRWYNTPFDLVPRHLEGVPVLAPRDADRYLTENYGDWRTPVQDYDCTTGTPNLTISPNFMSYAWFVLRLLHLSRTDALRFMSLQKKLLAMNFILSDNHTNINQAL